MNTQPELTIADIERAAIRIENFAVRTPLIENAALNERVGARVFIKPESLQRTGSFKFRGAFNRLSQLNPSERSAGVVAWSSGNHAQGVAAAAALLGVHATIVMPHDAPATKLANTRAYGATIVGYDRQTESREDIARKLVAQSGAVLVPSFEDWSVMAGQGTCGLELSAQVAERNAQLDALLVCCGGGGLIAGIATAFAARSSATAIYSVEPEGFDDYSRSLAAGRRVANTKDAHSFCDALLAPAPGEMTFSVNRRHLKGGLVVSDNDVALAMRYAFHTLKLVVEPGGAVALAALLANKLDFNGGDVGVVITGGNVDADVFAHAIADATAE